MKRVRIKNRVTYVKKGQKTTNVITKKAARETQERANLYLGVNNQLGGDKENS